MDQLRPHKAELLDLVELPSWPEASRDAVQSFRFPCARLYPFLGREILTPEGSGQLLQVFPERLTVVLDPQPERASVFLPSELRPSEVTAAGSLGRASDLAAPVSTTNLRT